MDLINHTLPPQEYVEHEGKLYRIVWNYIPSKSSNGIIVPEIRPPLKLIERDDRIFWTTHRGVIFSTNKDLRNVEIFTKKEFYDLTQTWNISIKTLPIYIPIL
jgi:hypothetical protein